MKVTIDIPENVEVGEYMGGIASNNILSEITIRVVPPLGDIQGMQDLTGMKEELQAMTESLSGELNDTKENLRERIDEVSQYQQNLTELETELAGLREESQELERENVQLTGQAVVVGSGQLAAGVLIGIVIVILFLWRARIGKALRRTRRAGGGQEAYKGWKPQ